MSRQQSSLLLLGGAAVAFATPIALVVHLRVPIAFAGLGLLAVVGGGLVLVLHELTRRP